MSALLLGGGVLGALCRYHLARIIQQRTPWPLGTVAINLSGSFLLGLIGGLLVAHPTWPREPILLAAGGGFCGAYTTFSSFAAETILLRRQGRRRLALLNGLAQPIAGAGGAAARPRGLARHGRFVVRLSVWTSAPRQHHRRACYGPPATNARRIARG